MRRELADSRAQIEAHIGKEAAHLAYPVGNPVAAGAREFQAAAELGFKSAVTTRPGMIFPAHDDRRTALPRLSINGTWQSLDYVEILLSGVPFALWKQGKAGRLNFGIGPETGSHFRVRCPNPAVPSI